MKNIEEIKDFLDWYEGLIFRTVEEIEHEKIAERYIKYLNDRKPNIMFRICPDCDGRKYFPDSQQTTGKIICKRCWGTGQVPK